MAVSLIDSLIVSRTAIKESKKDAAREYSLSAIFSLIKRIRSLKSDRNIRDSSFLNQATRFYENCIDNFDLATSYFTLSILR